LVSFYWFWRCFSSSLWWWGSAGEDLVVVAPAVMFSGGRECFRCGSSGSCGSGFASICFDGWWWQLEVMSWVVVARCWFADVFGFGVGGAGLRWWFAEAVVLDCVSYGLSFLSCHA
jgi:hypothetical protein